MTHWHSLVFHFLIKVAEGIQNGDGYNQIYDRDEFKLPDTFYGFEKYCS